ncbi:hypothetical protein D9M71_465660 [compost metagenome]
MGVQRVVVGVLGVGEGVVIDLADQDLIAEVLGDVRGDEAEAPDVDHAGDFDSDTCLGDVALGDCLCRAVPVVELDNAHVFVVLVGLGEVLQGDQAAGAGDRCHRVALGIGAALHLAEVLDAGLAVQPIDHLGVGVGDLDVRRQRLADHRIGLDYRDVTVTVLQQLGVLDGAAGVQHLQLGAGGLGDRLADGLAQAFVEAAFTAGAEGQLGGSRTGQAGDGQQHSEQDHFRFHGVVSSVGVHPNAPCRQGASVMLSLIKAPGRPAADGRLRGLVVVATGLPVHAARSALRRGHRSIQPAAYSPWRRLM